MTDNDVDLSSLAPVGIADAGQATTIEQSRAIAQVQAAVSVAAMRPRDFTRARGEMQLACDQWRFADRAFFRFPKAGKTVTGPSIHMARELARAYRNVEYGIAELDRDDEGGRSEMLAFAWDLETNTRSTTTFIVPHARDVTRQGKPERDPLVAMRDIYDNNANMAARRVRAMIFAVLPPHFVDEAEERAALTLHRGENNQPIQERALSAVALFDQFGVNQQRIETKLGRPLDSWDGYDLAQLRVVFRSIERSEVSVEDEFPQAGLTVADLAPPEPEAKADADAGAVEPEPEPEPEAKPDGDEVEAAPQVVTADALREAVTSSTVRAVTVPKALRALASRFPEESLADFESVAANAEVAAYLLEWVAGDGKVLEWVDGDGKVDAEAAES